MSKIKKKQAVWLLLIIIWMAVIFWFSHQPAEESSEISDSICYQIVDTIDKGFQMKWENTQLEQKAEAMSYPVRKTAHMTEYAVLAILILQLMYTLNKKYAAWKYYVIPQLSASIYAMTDEFHQLYIPGRCGAWTDVGIDSIGAAIGLIAALLAVKLIKEHKK